jgi:signal transduction histidine kinase
MKALGEAALQLPWLSPCAASLLALTRAPGAAVWSQVRHDPGLVLLLLRHGQPAGPTAEPSLFPALLREAAVLDAAHSYLQSCAGPTGWVSWDQAEASPVYRAALTYARLACRLAERTERCPPDRAWVGGLLTPLGHLALSAACFAAGAEDKETRRQGDKETSLSLTPCLLVSLSGQVARRLSRRWRLPPWLAAVAGHLGLPVEVTQALGADAELFQVVQLAVALVECQGRGLGLKTGRGLGDLLPGLGLSRSEAEALCSGAIREADAAADACTWESPYDLPLLPELLRLAAENRRLGDLPVLERLQDEVDVLHDALQEQWLGEGERLQARKLSALAELSAGASHEINNPLAVISGQAQYLLKKMQSAECKVQSAEEAVSAFCTLHSALCTSLETIIGQTQRIHQVLGDLMQFARPPAPHKQLVDVEGMIRTAAVAVDGLAQERQVRLVCQGPQAPVTLYADPAQVTRALTSLLRNAVEAAPAQGWAGVRVELPQPDWLHLVVEDSGRGPPAADRDHLFDPFYSGRKAGRGRGLGLPTAWRLARQHDGDVQLVSSPEGVTRFILSLPLAQDSAIRSQGSAVREETSAA